MRLITITIFCIVFFSVSSKGQTVFNTSPTGLKYKMFTHNTGPKPRVGDIIKFNFMLYTSNDSLLVSTFRSIVPVTTTVQVSSYKGDLEEAFKMMSTGDSGIFLVSADSFYSGQKMPVKPGSMLKMRIKMINVETAAEYEKEVQKTKDEYSKLKKQNNEEEQLNLDAYMKKNAPKAIRMGDGMYYIIEQQGSGPAPAKNQAVTIHYKGTTLQGKEVESDSGKATTFIMGIHEVIPGWEEGISLMKKGGKARLFIPSMLAYGERGVGRTIAPDTTLIYDIELLDIK